MRARTLGGLLVVAGLLAGCGGTDVVAADAAPPEASASPVGTPAVEVSARPTSMATVDPGDPVPGLSAKTIRRLRTDRIWTFQVVDEATEHPHLSAADILALPPQQKKRPTEMALVRTWYHGDLDLQGMTKKEVAAVHRRVASYQNQLLWLLIIDDVTYPVMGPPGRGGPDTYVSDMAAYLDPKTGKFVRGGNF